MPLMNNYNPSGDIILSESKLRKLEKCRIIFGIMLDDDVFCLHRLVSVGSLAVS